jgi:hypothetical protein
LFAYPSIVYRGSEYPELDPKLWKGDCLYTTPDFDLAESYAGGIVEPWGHNKRVAYILEFDVTEGLKILDMNKASEMPEIMERYLGRRLRSERDYADKLFYISEHSPKKFIRLLKSLDYNGIYIERPEDEYKILCLFDLSYLTLNGFFTVKMQYGSHGFSIPTIVR